MEKAHVALYRPWPVKLFHGGTNEKSFALRRVAVDRLERRSSIRSDDGLHKMAKTNSMMMTMQDGPAKMGMFKEMGMANTEMSKGNMRGARMHYMSAQKMSMMKSAM